MEGRLCNSLMLVALVVVAMFHVSLAQTTHVVGDSMGWTVPPGGEVAYRTWAVGKTFRISDILVFNFATNAHDVAEVSKASFGSCSTSNSISMATTGPARISLTSPGEHHFICTISQHCGLGQKLAINVSAASVAPAPQPATPRSPSVPPTRSPVAAPQPSTSSPTPTVAPTPERAATTYTVGDNLGWTVPPGGPAAYQTWAQGKNFAVGDTLVFNFARGQHDVLEVTRTEFESCNVSTTNTGPITASPARVTITSAGNHYYICAIPGHCSLGQKLAIRATTGGDSTSAPSPSSDSPTSQPTAPSTPSPVATPPSPGNSSPSTKVTSLSFALMVAALSFFLYN